MVNAFVQSLERLPRSQVIIGAVLGSFGLSALLIGYTAAIGKDSNVLSKIIFSLNTCYFVL